jgi:CRISPR-associated endonuclease Cas1
MCTGDDKTEVMSNAWCCSARSGLSAGARSWALTNDVEVILASRRGGYLGQVVAASTRRVRRLRTQLACSEDEQRWLPFARAVIEAKINKQIVLLQRMTRRERHDELAEANAAMRGLAAMLADANTRDEIMGLEGAAAREYFTALRCVVPEPLRFNGRSRRPPLDVVNAALSYGYTLLLGEAVAALAAAGLDPAIGLLHTDADRRPSLALDLIEEFRPLVVDQVVITAARTGRLGAEHGRSARVSPGFCLPRPVGRLFWTATNGVCCIRRAVPCPVMRVVFVGICLVPLCGTCWTGIGVLGQATVDPDQLYWVVV